MQEDSISTATRYQRCRKVLVGVNRIKNNLSLDFIREEWNDEVVVVVWEGVGDWVIGMMLSELGGGGECGWKARLSRCDDGLSVVGSMTA